MATYTITPIKESVAAGEGYAYSSEIPVSGILARLFIHFPPGCAGLVDVAAGVRTGGQDLWLVPARTGTYIALDNVTYTFYPNEPVRRGDKLWAHILNADTTFTHTITVSGEVEAEGNLIDLGQW